MSQYDWVTDEMFCRKLAEIVKDNASDLLSIPGAYEVFSEHFHNDVLEALEAERDRPTNPSFVRKVKKIESQEVTQED